VSLPAPIALGIDVGGTKTSFAIVDVTSGRIAEEHRIETPQGDKSGKAFLALVETTARDFVSSSSAGSVSAIGLGVCELVDRQGLVKSCHRVHWRGLAVREQLSRIAPTVVESDVRAAALAEAHYGAGRGYREFLYLNIGTGISSAWVMDGIPHAGARGHALVVASAPTTALCPECGKLHDTVLEDMAGGAALVTRYRAKSGLAISNAGDVIAKTEVGDANARQVIAEATAVLGSALGMAIGMLDPEALIIGGGLGSSSGIYWEQLKAETRRHIWSDETRELDIKQAALGSKAGVIGAARAGYMAQGISSPKLR